MSSESVEAAVVVFAVDDPESLEEAARILRHLKSTNFIESQVGRTFHGALDSSMEGSNDIGAGQYFEKADFFMPKLLLKIVNLKNTKNKQFFCLENLFFKAKLIVNIKVV